MKAITRGQLYALVWSRPMREIAKSLGVSDVALGKCCRKAGIPLPGLGYWAKIAAGKAPSKTALAPRAPGMSHLVELPLKAKLTEIAPLLEQHSDALLFEDLEVIAARTREALGRVAVPQGLAKSHPHVARVLREDEERDLKHGGSIFSSSLGSVFTNRFERRRLRVLSALFAALSRLGLR
jgi:hypothetical protein